MAIMAQFIILFFIYTPVHINAPPPFKKKKLINKNEVFKGDK